MDCARCGGELETYTLGGNEAYVCGECGFVDTPVDHEATPRPEPEPWEEALERFYETYVDGEAAVTGSGETAALVELASEDDSTDDSDDEPEDDRASEESESKDGAESTTEETEKPA